MSIAPARLANLGPPDGSALSCRPRKPSARPPDSVFTFTCHPIIGYTAGILDIRQFLKERHACQIDAADLDSALEVFAKRALSWARLNIRS